MSEPRERRTRPLSDPRLRSLAEDSGYTILERIGAGGMGIVYRARDADGREVAIKLLRHEIADDPRARERLRREVEAQRRAGEDGIARILDAELDSPDAFIVTEFVPGPTLEDAVRDRGGLHPELVRELGIALAETLEGIHGSGVLHRDLKPSNILLRGARPADLDDYDPDGDALDPVIIDFGIAQAAEQSRLTSTGLVMGTAAYLDPEVVRSNDTSEGSDWWSWAAMLAFAATGREPFGSGRADVVYFRADQGRIDLDGVPEGLAAWLRSALRADPAERIGATILIERLESLELDEVPEWAEDRDLPDGGADGGIGSAGRGAEPADGGSHAAGDGMSDAGRTVALPVMGAGAAAGAAGNAAGGERTEVLPAGGWDESPDSDDRTEAVPAGGWGAPPDLDDRTEALPRYEDSSDSAERSGHQRRRGSDEVTRALPAIGASDETRPLPVFTEPPTETLPPAYGSPAPTGATASAPQHRTVQHRAGGAFAAPHQTGADVPSPADRPERDYAPAPQQAYPSQQDPHAFQHYAPQQAPVGYPPVQQPYGPAAGGFVEPPPPCRPLLLWLGHAVLIALAAVAPMVSLGLMLLLGALARTWQGSHRSLAKARMQGRGSRAGASAAVGAAAPFRFVLALLQTVLLWILPLLLGVIVALGADAIVSLTAGSLLPDGALYAIAIGLSLLLAWVGLGARPMRDGAHRMLDAAAPDRVWGTVIGCLLGALLLVVILVAAARGGAIDPFPLADLPRPSDLLPWRR